MKHKQQAAPLANMTFFESLIGIEEGSPPWVEHVAGLLCMRLFDAWWRDGPSIVEPDSTGASSLRAAISALEHDAALRVTLLGILNAMQAVRVPGVSPVLPRLYAYAGLLMRRSAFGFAVNVLEAIIAVGDEDRDGDLVNDALLALGYCRREMGMLLEAESHYRESLSVARWRRDRHRALESQIGLANVTRDRGDLPRADAILAEVSKSCRSEQLLGLESHALRDRAIVAQRRGDLGRAIVLTYQSLEGDAGALHREKAFANLGAFFLAIGAHRHARSALIIQEATAAGNPSRLRARINLLSLAAREGDAKSFDHLRAQLGGADLTPDLRTNYLIECARGLKEFGNVPEARELLAEAGIIAHSHHLNRALFEVEEMLATLHAPITRPAAAASSAATERVGAALQRIARTVTA